MYTSENKREGTVNCSREKLRDSADAITSGGHDLRISFLYLAVSIFLMIAGAIYEHFSFGVYSNYIIYAFAVPLIGGTLPYMLRQITGLKKEVPGMIDSDIYHAAIVTLTIGSIVHGALAICGRPNSLTVIYPAAAFLLLTAAGLLKHLKNHCRGDTDNYTGGYAAK